MQTTVMEMGEPANAESGEMEWHAADGSDMVPQQVIELSRDYISVPTNSSGTEGEREILSRELRREMAASILRRVDAASRAVAPRARSAARP